MTTSLKEPILLGIDYGSTNIGLAFGTKGLVMPIANISGKNDLTAIKEITRYAMENKVDKIIMGLPLSEENKETPQSLRIRKFAKLLKIKLKKPLDFVNEYYSSFEANLDMLAEQKSQKARKTSDQYAAAIILKRYFAER